MKILEINNNDKPVGGAETVFQSTIKVLLERGHEVATLSLNNQGAESTHKKYFVNDKKYFHNRFYSFEAKNILEILIQNEKPNIAHVHTFIGGVTTSILPILKKRNIPIILSIHGFKLLCPVHVFINGRGEYCEECKGKKFYKCVMNKCDPQGFWGSVMNASESYLRHFLFPFDKYIDQYIFVSEYIKKKYLEYYPELEKKSNVLYNPHREYFRNEVKGDYFLFFGRLAREKGLLTLINAFKKSPEINLKIAGNGPLLEIIQQNKSNNIELVGFKSGKTLEDLIRNSSFVVIPSECPEALSMSTVEAFANGKPVIGSKLGALPELIIENERGFLFEPKNSDQLNNILLKVNGINDKEYYNLSKNVFDFARNHFSFEHYYSRLITVFEKAIAKKKTYV